MSTKTPKNLTIGKKFGITLTVAAKSYKTVTIYYKGVILISIKVKIISVVLAFCFALSGATLAFAGENSESALPSSLSASNGKFLTTAPVNSLFEKNGFEVKAKNITKNSADLTWKSSKQYIGYKICRFNILSNKWEEIAQTTKEKYEVEDLSAGSIYRFCVLNAVSDDVLGAIQIKTKVKKPKLKVIEKTSKKIVLNLGTHSKNETVVIYRKTSGKKFKKIAEVKGKSTYTDKNLKGNTTYYYKAITKFKLEGEAFKSKESAVLKTKTLLSMDLPSVSGKTKTFAYYTAVTLRSSPQYKLLRSEKCTTDEETGIRMYDGCYCVALGSYYATKIGTKFRITFSNGNSIKVILCDQKANRHTDSKHQYAVNNKDIVEFYVQGNKIPRAIRGRGNYGILKQFSGSVVSIEKYMD
ncbi:MAG: fibronectin type III domain-containing protein [Eubacterium sp.]|nr:fibronectin type III domain-containing protein [Eubacterium sp.]